MATPRESTAKKSAAKKSTARKASASKAVKKTPKKSPKKPASKTTAKTAKKTAKKTAAASRTSARTPSTRRSAADQLTEYQRKRDFNRTAEPSGSAPSTRSADPKRAATPLADQLRFVIQKHDASRLHYDLRLEMDGVMKSWAVPKGPSADPSVKRLAMQVEDHPIAYNTFEGTIPAGEYGGGTVMLWDTGTYEIENAPTDDQNSAARDGHERGELKLNFHGKRIKGSYALVRTRGMGGNAAKPSWLLIKHRDEKAHPESSSVLTEKYMKSVTTGRSMEQISKGGDSLS